MSESQQMKSEMERRRKRGTEERRERFTPVGEDIQV